MNRQDLTDPAMSLGDFIIDSEGTLRCSECHVGPGESKTRRVGWCETPYTLLQFVLAAADHVRDHHPGMRWAP